jgi:hypothetical protein
LDVALLAELNAADCIDWSRAIIDDSSGYWATAAVIPKRCGNCFAGSALCRNWKTQNRPR